MELRDTARDAAAALGLALHDPHRDVRARAGLALMRLDQDARPATADLVRALEVRVAKGKDPEDYERFLLIYLMRAVGNLGTDAAAALPALERALPLVADIANQHELARWAIDRCKGLE